jgi:hypothetical protein
MNKLKVNTLSRNKSISLKLVEQKYSSKNKGHWDGSSFKRIIFTELYLQNKYDTILHTTPFLNLNLITSYNQGNPAEYHSFILDISNTGFILLNKQNINYIKSLFIQTNKRYTFYPVSLSVSYNGMQQEYGSHSAFFLYDKKFNKVELFDSMRENIGFFKPDIKLFFNSLYGSKIKIIYPNKKLQTIAELYLQKCSKYNLNYTTKGFCVVWTLWYLEMILSNPKMTTDKVYQKTINLLNIEPDIICKIPDGYAHFINETTKNYELSFVNDTLKIILKKDKVKYIIPKKLILLLGVAGALFYTLNRLLFKKSKKI